MHELLHGDTLEVAGGQSGVLAAPLGRLVLPRWVQHNTMKAQLAVCCSMQQILVDKRTAGFGKICITANQTCICC